MGPDGDRDGDGDGDGSDGSAYRGSSSSIKFVMEEPHLSDPSLLLRELPPPHLTQPGPWSPPALPAGSDREACSGRGKEEGVRRPPRVGGARTQRPTPTASTRLSSCSTCSCLTSLHMKHTGMGGF